MSFEYHDFDGNTLPEEARDNEEQLTPEEYVALEDIWQKSNQCQATETSRDVRALMEYAVLFQRVIKGIGDRKMLCKIIQEYKSGPLTVRWNDDKKPEVWKMFRF